MSDEHSSNGHKSWLDRIAQAFAQEPKTRQELFDLLREANRNKLLDNDALAIIEGAIEVADQQVRDIMIPRSKMVSIKATQTPEEFLPAIMEAAHSRYPVTGETTDEVKALMDDLLNVGCSILTIGQYLQPSRKHYPVVEYITPEQFEEYKDLGIKKGFKNVVSGPLVRSSYHAEQHISLIP